MPPFTDFANKIKQSLTPITDGLRLKFGIGAKAPSDTTISPKLSTPAFPSAASSTPLADSLRQRFGVGSTPSFLDSYTQRANERQSALKQNVSPFLKTVLEKAGMAVHEVAPAVDSAVNEAVSSFFTKRADLAKGVGSDVLKGDFQTARKRVVNQLAESGLGTLNLAGTLAQGFNEGVFNIATSLIKAAVPSFELGQENKVGPSLLRDITGRDRIYTYQESTRDLYNWSLENGASENQAKFLAGFGLFGRFIVDQPEFSGPSKAAIKLTDNAMERLAKESTDDGIKAIIKADNPALTDDALSFFTPIFRNANSREEVEQGIKLVNNAAAAFSKKAEERAIIAKAKDGMQEIPTELRALADEARKYKNADEFRAGVSKNEFRYGDSVKKDASVGEIPLSRFDGKDIRASQNTVDAAGVKQWEKKIQAGERPRVLVEMKADGPRVIDGHTRLTAYKNLGIENIPVIDNGGKVVADGRPLDSIFERAYTTPDSQKISGDLFAGKNDPVDVNLVKSLATAKDPYEVLNIVKNAFPNLPDRVADKFVDRFVKTKRIANVESLAKAARNLNQSMRAGGSIRVAGEAKSVGKIIESTIPKATRKYLRQDQKLTMIKSLKEKFDDPKSAVAAQEEHDRIWDDLNQKVVDEYENLSMQKSFMEDVLSSDDEGIAAVYKKLFTGPNKKNAADDSVMELQEIHNRAVRHKKALQNYRATGASGDKKWKGKVPPLTKTEEYAAELDKYLVDAGIEDGSWDVAQGKIERYAATLAEVKDLKERIKALKPRVREARILQQSLDDIAIIPQKEVSEIDKTITAANFRDNFKDISGFSAQTRDLVRNFESFFGKELYPKIKKAVLDPFDDAKAARVDEVKKIGDDIEKGVIEKFGFARGSKESAAIQRYGDPDLPAPEQMKYDDLVREFGRPKADNIVKADAWFRTEYDRLIDELNVVRKKIYPNNPSKLIAKRKNYYRHFREMQDTWGDALREFFETPSGISPNLAGTSEFTKAKTRFLPFAETRKGQETDIDAIGGFLSYAELFSYAKHIDPHVSRFRYLHRKIAEVAPKVGEEIKLPNGTTAKSKGAENMLWYLDNFARDLTGNTNPVDRWIQSFIGRKNLRAARFINNRLKANTIGGNFGSAIAQVANVPAGLADTGPLYFARGMKRALAGTVVKNEAAAKSIFLKERYQDYLKERFPLKFSDKPLKASGEKAKKLAAWVMQRADQVGTTAIWNAQYEKALGLARKGKDVGDAIKYADDKTRKIVAGRGIGEVPLAQKAVISQFVIPFTLEVGNAWWIMKGWVKEKEFAALATFFIANYVLNEVAEKTRGSRVTFDPINGLVEGVQSLSNEFKEGNYGRGVLKLLGREAGEILSNIPLGQQVAAIIPDKDVQDLTKTVTGAPMTKQEIFGNSTAGRYGTPLIANVLNLEDTLYRLLPPVGGLQIKKTIAGIKALLTGQAEDSKGQPTFNVPSTPQNVARALLFGAGATSEARKFYDERSDLFERIDRQEAAGTIRAAAAEADYAELKKLRDAGKGDQAASKLAQIAQEDRARATAIVDIMKAEALGLTGNDRLIKMLNVNNGERAKYIVLQLKKVKTGDERAAYLQDLVAKKLVSKEVLKQVILLYGGAVQ